MVSWRAESEVQQSLGERLQGAGLKEGTGKILCLKVPLKKANNELL